MNHRLFIILYISIWVLLPIIPAYLMYRALPMETIGEKTSVKGVISGFKINLTGGFSGYFALLLLFLTLLRGVVNVELDAIRMGEPEVWTILGTIEQATEQAKAVVTPPGHIVQPGGSIAYKISFPRMDLPDSNQVTPIVSVHQDGYAELDFYFLFRKPKSEAGVGPYTYVVDEKLHTITCRATLVKPKDEYNNKQEPLTLAHQSNGGQP
jgi:hypothetical protein